MLLACMLFLTAPKTAVRKHTEGIGGTCSANLETIFEAIKRYASEHDGNLPDNLETLLRHGYLSTPADLLCPGSDDSVPRGDGPEEWVESMRRGAHNSYSYGGRGLQMSSGGHLAIIWDTTSDNHIDRMRGRYTLFLNGTIRFEGDKADIQN